MLSIWPFAGFTPGFEHQVADDAEDKYEGKDDDRLQGEGQKADEDDEFLDEQCDQSDKGQDAADPPRYT